MKLMRIGMVYPLHLQKFHLNHPHLPSQSYSFQKNAIDTDLYGEIHFWENSFLKHNIAIVDFISNSEVLQKTWAQENATPYSEKEWYLDISEAQIIKEKPTVLFIDDFLSFPTNWIQKIKDQNPSIHLIMTWCGIDFEDPLVFKPFDFIMSNVPETVQKLKIFGLKAQFIKHAFPQKILQHIQKNEEKKYPLSFIGSLHRLLHSEREKFLIELKKEISLDIFSSNKIELKDVLRFIPLFSLYFFNKKIFPLQNIFTHPRIKKFLSKPHAPHLSIHPYLIRSIKPAVYGLNMYQTLLDSEMTFNIHPNFSKKSACNMRLFEATGVGTCLITDWKENISESFEPDYEVVTYKNIQECKEKIKFLINHPQERKKIALAGQQRTLKDHTWEDRIQSFVEVIQKNT